LQHTERNGTEQNRTEHIRSDQSPIQNVQERTNMRPTQLAHLI